MQRGGSTRNSHPPLKFFNPRVSHGMRPNSYIFEIASSTSICDSGAHSQLIFHSSSSNLFLSNNPVGGATLCRYIGLTDASIKLERQPRNSRAATAIGGAAAIGSASVVRAELALPSSHGLLPSKREGNLGGLASRGELGLGLGPRKEETCT